MIDGFSVYVFFTGNYDWFGLFTKIFSLLTVFALLVSGFFKSSFRVTAFHRSFPPI